MEPVKDWKKDLGEALSGERVGGPGREPCVGWDS